MMLKRGVWMLLPLLLFVPRRASSFDAPAEGPVQEMYGSATASYDADTDTIYASAEAFMSYSIAYYYDMGMFSELSDSSGDYDDPQEFDSDNGEATDHEQDFEVDNAGTTYGEDDTFNLSSSYWANLDDFYYFLGNGRQFTCCGCVPGECGFVGGGCYFGGCFGYSGPWCGFSGCCFVGGGGGCSTPPDPESFSGGSDSASASTPTSCFQGADLDTLITEYTNYDVANYNGGPNGPACNDFSSSTPGTLSPTYPFNGNSSYLAIASQGDIEDWAILADDAISNLNAFNSSPPSPLNGSPFIHPFALGAWYRTPIHNCSDVYKDTTAASCIAAGQNSSSHEYGDALDIATNTSSWSNYYNLLSWVESQSSSGACVENVNTSGSPPNHVHVDWERDPGGFEGRSTCRGNEYAIN